MTPRNLFVYIFYSKSSAKKTRAADVKIPKFNTEFNSDAVTFTSRLNFELDQCKFGPRRRSFCCSSHVYYFRDDGNSSVAGTVMICYMQVQQLQQPKILSNLNLAISFTLRYCIVKFGVFINILIYHYFAKERKLYLF